MEISKAIDMFNIKNISEESDKTLKRRYKKLMLKYHPDNYNGNDNKAKELNLAYNELKNIVKGSEFLDWENKQKLEKENQKKVLVIKLNELIDIYKGNNVTIDGIKINSKNIRKHNIIIEYSILLIHNNIKKEFKASKQWNNEDIYKVYCNINVDEDKLNNKEEINISVPTCNIEKIISFSSQSINFRISLDSGIIMSVIIDKKIKKDK